jgi:hypothetical protein
MFVFFKKKLSSLSSFNSLYKSWFLVSDQRQSAQADAEEKCRGVMEYWNIGIMGS